MVQSRRKSNRFMPRKPLDSELGHGSLSGGHSPIGPMALWPQNMLEEARCQADRGINRCYTRYNRLFKEKIAG